jgi:hypothetical protein
VYSLCTVSIQTVYSQCTICVQSVYSPCIVCVQSVYSLCTVRVQSVYWPTRCTTYNHVALSTVKWGRNSTIDDTRLQNTEFEKTLAIGQARENPEVFSLCTDADCSLRDRDSILNRSRGYVFSEKCTVGFCSRGTGVSFFRVKAAWEWS